MNREQLFSKIIQQVAKGHESDFEALAKEIDNRDEPILIAEYQKVVDGLGDNPTIEKDLSDIMEQSAKQECSQFEIAAHILGKDFVKATDMNQITLLIKKATDKVLLFTDEKGIVKKTESFESYEPMKPIDRMKFENLKLSYSKEKDAKKQDKISKEIDKFVAQKTNIDIEKLSTWEKGLLQEILQHEAKGISNIFLGKK